ncbi:MAG: methionyl-tRNA formyltransferase [Chlorobi bacterium]|nr:methionyl-tRNA formyltransferase [Chlorobiota bacterium]
MRVIFMGTPDFAIPSLEAIVEAGYTIPLVVTLPDKPKGRGRKLSPSPVKARAEELGIEVATPGKLRDPEFLELLSFKKPDVICVVAFRILPGEVFSIPSRGSFNLHGSLLPKYRGAAPINRAIMAGERETGVTTFFLKRKVDTGDVILKKRIPIGPEMTAGELRDIMKIVGAEAVIETLRLIEEGGVKLEPQADEEATPAPKIFREDCRIDWSQPAVQLHNMIRGLSPYPGAFTLWEGKSLKVLRAKLGEKQGLGQGEVLVEEERLFVGAGDGSLELAEVQREGKRVMGVTEFLRGISIPQATRFD